MFKQLIFMAVYEFNNPVRLDKYDTQPKINK